jgi:hypothetical protein
MVVQRLIESDSFLTASDRSKQRFHAMVILLSTLFSTLVGSVGGAAYQGFWMVRFIYWTVRLFSGRFSVSGFI